MEADPYGRTVFFIPRREVSIQVDIINSKQMFVNLPGVLEKCIMAHVDAEVLVTVSGAKRGGVKHISYNSYADSASTCRSYVCAASAGPIGEDDMPRVELEPEPIKIECSVDMEWWLE